MNFHNDQHLDLGSPIPLITSQEIGYESSSLTLANTSSSSNIIEQMENEQVSLEKIDGPTSEEKSIEVRSSWYPMAISTPIVTTTAPRTDKDIENELFHDIKEIVRKFLRRPNCDYPYYRVIRWVEGEHPKLEHVLTVVINQPTVVSERRR